MRAKAPTRQVAAIRCFELHDDDFGVPRFEMTVGDDHRQTIMVDFRDPSVSDDYFQGSSPQIYRPVKDAEEGVWSAAVESVGHLLRNGTADWDGGHRPALRAAGDWAT